MSNIKTCPCGVVPSKLDIYDSNQGGKWAFAVCPKCAEWHIEFRTHYHPLDSDECMELAIEEWNAAPRFFE